MSEVETEDVNVEDLVDGVFLGAVREEDGSTTLYIAKNKAVFSIQARIQPEVMLL